MPVEEGERYKLGGIAFYGNEAVNNVKALRRPLQAERRRPL